MLVLIAVLCMALTFAVTIAAAFKQSARPGQTMLGSITEAWTNVAIGFGINYAANLAVLPLAGFDIGYADAFWVGCIFTGISVIRSFLIRRIFNRVTHKA